MDLKTDFFTFFKLYVFGKLRPSLEWISWNFYDLRSFEVVRGHQRSKFKMVKTSFHVLWKFWHIWCLIAKHNNSVKVLYQHPWAPNFLVASDQFGHYFLKRPKIWAHKVGLTHSLCIMHLMYVYIHENSEIKFLLFWTLIFDDLSRSQMTSDRKNSNWFILSLVSAFQKHIIWIK